MGRSILSKLPEELTGRVFACLPISEVFKCRLVCKQWNFILTSHSFNELWTSFSPSNPWFFVYQSSGMVAAYDSASSKWTNIPLYQLCSLDLGKVELMASAGGLLCFGSKNLKHSTLIVCNPLTKSRKLLPKMLQISYIDNVGIVADKTTNSCRILVKGIHETRTNGSITELYDSRLGKWIHQCISRQKFVELLWYNEHTIWHKGVFYWLDMLCEEGHCRLLKYDMERREWADLVVKMPDVVVKMPSNNIRCQSLIKCGGRMLLVGEIMKDRSISSIGIWEVRMDSLEGVRVDVMPRQVLRKIGYLESLQCQGNNNLICFSTYRAMQCLVYDLLDRSWQFLPENRAWAWVKMIGRNYRIGMSYDPNLAAKV